MYFTRKVKRYRYESPREETREVQGSLALVSYSHMPCHIPLNEGWKRERCMPPKWGEKREREMMEG
jgi:hypothetical protein